MEPAPQTICAVLAREDCADARQRPCPRRRRPDDARVRVGAPEHARVEHPRQAHVARVCRPAGDALDRVDARRRAADRGRAVRRVAPAPAARRGAAGAPTPRRAPPRRSGCSWRSGTGCRSSAARTSAARRLRVSAVEQRRARHQLARRAEPALRCVVIDERLLQVRQAAVRARAPRRSRSTGRAPRRPAGCTSRPGFPSISTVHAPHSPRSQPILVPVSPRWSRSTSASVQRSSTSTCLSRAVDVQADRRARRARASDRRRGLFCGQGRDRGHGEEGRARALEELAPGKVRTLPAH